jgi:hypothetical protein
VADDLHLLDPDLVEQRVEEAPVRVKRVFELAALGRAAESGQIGRDPTRPLEEWQPVLGARRGAVEVEDGRPRLRGASVDDRSSCDLDRVLVDAHPEARITSS